MRIIRTSALTLIMLCCAVCFYVSTAYALSPKDLSGLMWIFTVQANNDGSLIDTDTLTLTGRFSKTEVKELLTAVDPVTKKPGATQLASFEDMSLYRIAGSDMLLHCLFDSAGISKYCYILPTKISPEEQ